MGFFKRAKEDFELVREEKKADRLARLGAYSEAKEVAREERTRQTIKLAREREQVRGENKSKSLREGSSFMGGLGSLIEKATRPAPRRTKRKRKKAKMSRTMTQSSIFGNRGGGFF